MLNNPSTIRIYDIAHYAVMVTGINDHNKTRAIEDLIVAMLEAEQRAPVVLAVPESEDAFFEKSKILGEYSIDLINQSDEFNGQMLAAMEAYAQFRLLASRDEEIKRLREAAKKVMRATECCKKDLVIADIRNILSTNTTPTNE